MGTTEDMTAVNCPYGDSLVVADYLAGRLGAAQAQAFEAHTFDCDRCFTELQQATELRAVAASDRTAEAAGSRSAPRPHWLAWPALGLAAAVALALGVWFTQPVTDRPPLPAETVFRDAAQNRGELPLEISRKGDSVILSWPPVQQADRYSVRIWSEAGEPLFEQDATGRSIELSATGVRTQGVYVQVVAVDELQQTIARSELVPL